MYECVNISIEFFKQHSYFCADDNRHNSITYPLHMHREIKLILYFFTGKKVVSFPLRLKHRSALVTSDFLERLHTRQVFADLDAISHLHQSF